MNLTAIQEAAATVAGSTFLLGPAGTGKTTALHQRLLALLEQGEIPYAILVLVSEAAHREGFVTHLDYHGAPQGDELTVTTYTALAREMVRLFWPIVAAQAGFRRAYQPPTSVTYDMAQLLMWRVINPLLRSGAFAGLRLRPQQLVSQLLDIAERAAWTRRTLDETVAQTISTTVGTPEELQYLQDARVATQRYRELCLRHNILDLSLTIEVFDRHLLGHADFRRYFSERFRHALVDNFEEQPPAAQAFVTSLLDSTASLAVAFDAGGGYRRLLAADPRGASQFAALCDQTLHFEESFTRNVPLTHLANLVENYLMTAHETKPVKHAQMGLWEILEARYRPEMVAALPPLLNRLMSEYELEPRDIALIAPYLDGTLTYGLEQAFQDAHLPYMILRRRSSPRDEPRIRTWLTLLALAHPEWEMPPQRYDVAEALTLSIAGLDPARAQLLAEVQYDAESGTLLPLDAVYSTAAERIDPELLDMVEQIRIWLEAEGRALPLDTFIEQLFGTLLSQPPYQPKPDAGGEAVCDWLVRTAGKVLRTAEALAIQEGPELAEMFIGGIYQGLVTADPPELGEPPDPEGIVIAPVHTFLLSNRVVRCQVWLDVAAHGWWDLPRQPLSNVFVLLPNWQADRLWTMEEDYRTRNQLLSRIVRGLTARCTGGVVLATSELDRRGQRQDGPLWRAIQPILPAIASDTSEVERAF